MTEKTPKPVSVPPPYFPAQSTPAAWAAIKALAAGTATSAQQIAGLKYIVEDCCDTYGLGWHPDGEGAAAFVAGRRFAGLQIIKALNLQQGVLTKKGTEHG